MNFFQHTATWIEGEIFEATLFGFIGLAWIIIALLLWKMGGTPNAKAMFLPLLFIGMLLGVNAIFGVRNNNQRMDQLQLLHDQDPVAFAHLEKERVEGFQGLFTMTQYIALFAFAFTIAVFFLTENAHWRSVGIGLSILGITGLIIDLFAKERADTYYSEIMKYIG